MRSIASGVLMLPLRQEVEVHLGRLVASSAKGFSRVNGGCSNRLKLLGFGGGYAQSMPLFLHRWQHGICLPHFLLALAQALHALGSAKATILGLELLYFLAPFFLSVVAI